MCILDRQNRIETRFFSTKTVPVELSTYFDLTFRFREYNPILMFRSKRVSGVQQQMATKFWILHFTNLRTKVQSISFSHLKVLAVFVVWLKWCQPSITIVKPAIGIVQSGKASSKWNGFILQTFRIKNLWVRGCRLGWAIQMRYPMNMVTKCGQLWMSFNIVTELDMPIIKKTPEIMDPQNRICCHRIADRKIRVKIKINNKYKNKNVILNADSYRYVTACRHLWGWRVRLIIKIEEFQNK